MFGCFEASRRLSRTASLPHIPKVLRISFLAPRRCTPVLYSFLTAALFIICLPVLLNTPRITQHCLASGPLRLRWREHRGGRSGWQAFLQPETPQHGRLLVFSRPSPEQHRRPGPAAAHEPGHVPPSPRLVPPNGRFGRRRRWSSPCPAGKTGCYEEVDRRRRDRGCNSRRGSVGSGWGWGESRPRGGDREREGAAAVHDGPRRYADGVAGVRG